MPTAIPKFKTIVVATDLSDSSSLALRYAQAIAQNHEAKLILMHVVDPVSYAFPEGAPDAVVAVEAARAELQRIEEEARRQGITVHSMVETGVVCERISLVLKEHHADLLVLGTRARTQAGRSALGAVARRLIAKSPCAILTVSPDAEKQVQRAGRWRIVLAATDFSAASVSALRVGHQLSQGIFTVLHVKSCNDATPCGNCIERLRYLAPFNESHSVPVDHVVVSGNAGEVIPRYAKNMFADLVVLGSPNNVLKEEDFPSSTVLQVIERLTCPVLCIPVGVEPPTAPDRHKELAVSC